MIKINRNKQKGAALVEVALTILLYLAIIFAIIEFSLLLFTWGRSVETLRNTVRTLIVNDPIIPLDTLYSDCFAGTASSIGPTDCLSNTVCQNSVQNMLLDVAVSSLNVTYSCSLAGHPDRPEELIIPSVKVDLTVNYTFHTAGILGLAPTASHTFSLARTGEDMHTFGTP